MIQVASILLLCIIAGPIAPAPAPASNHVPCLNNMKAVTNFNASKFAGIWYEVRNYYPRPGHTERCVAIKYKLKGDGSFDVAYNALEGKATQPQTVNATLKSTGAPTEGKLTSFLAGRPNKIYTVFSIVYDKFFATCTCTDGSTDVSIFARTRTIDDKAFASATAVLAQYPTLKQNVLKVVDQKGCRNTV